ncbi:MAG: RloB family protein [Bacteroidota bacterium]|nr:RloB family protein [Bacteroidota bacterium]MDP4192596.1 RloB family protein [Bacteroidota bacterium]
MRKKRGYKRETPAELVRDYKLFAIACEGSKTEPEYFGIFEYFSPKIKVDIIESKVSDAEMLATHNNRSAPKWVLDRAMKYIERVGLIDEDELWFVMDIDKWSPEQIREIAEYCAKYINWHIVLSNPCFEVWLYFHKKSDISKSKSVNSQDFKTEITSFFSGGYNPYKIIHLLPDAIANAKANDSDPDHYAPKHKETKVYLLGEAIMNTIGKNDFEDFVKNKLPNLRKLKIRVPETKPTKSPKRK